MKEGRKLWLFFMLCLLLLANVMVFFRAELMSSLHIRSFFNLAEYVNISLANTSWEAVEGNIRNVQPGGRFRPADQKLAIIVPYRDREEHLKIFLNYMHPFLQRQRRDYTIFVVEMPPGVMFNRGLLMNVGYVEALKEEDFGCFIFHDVDLLPEMDSNIYGCEHSPKHLSTAISSKGYRLPYPNFFGGVCAISKEDYRKINGFSNLYFGWGQEDDDLLGRVFHSNLTVTRLSRNVGRYTMVSHKPADPGLQGRELLNTSSKRYLADGLNSLRYKVITMERKRLYTWILISINETTAVNTSNIT